MNVTICGPNLPRPLSDRGTMHIHATGCADLRKYPKDQHGAGTGVGWTLGIERVKDAILDIYPPDNFDYDPESTEYCGYRQDVYVAPCVKVSE